MKIIIPLLLLFGISSTAVQAQFDTGANAPARDFFAVASNSASFLPVAEAYRLLPTVLDDKLLLQWDIADGYYLYKNRFAAQLTNGGQMQPLELDLPDGKLKQDEYFGKVEVFYQQVTAELPLPQAVSNFQLQVTSQGCADAGLCYPPYTQNFQVDVAAGTVLPLQKTHVDPLRPAQRPANASQQTTAPASFWLMALFAFMGGILLNLMPCVFPVLALKVLGLVQANAESARHRRLHGLAYSGGVLFSFLCIAGLLLTLRSAGAALGWGFQLQSPWVVAGLVYLFFILGLSLSGVAEIGGRWVGVGQSLTEKGGAIGSFFTGVLAVIVASPCSAPFMGTALGFAVLQPALVGLSIFLALGLGMATPFLLLVSVPALARLLPKPGAWMNTLKQVLALPLYATAVWLLWVIGRQTGANGMAAVLAGCLLLVAALWLARRASTALRAGGVAVASVAFLLLASPLLDPAGVAGAATDPATAYSPERVEEQRTNGKPVFLNVTADWCVTCIANERVALASQAVQAAFANKNVTYLKGDWTNSAPHITELLAQYGRSGVPLYLLFPPDPATAAIVLPQLLTPGLIIDALDSLPGADNS